MSKLKQLLGNYDPLLLRAKEPWLLVSDRNNRVFFDVGCVFLLTLEGVRRQRLPLRALMYHRSVTGGSVDGWFLCGGVKLQEAEGAKIPVVREVKSGQAFPPCQLCWCLWLSSRSSLYGQAWIHKLLILEDEAQFREFRGFSQSNTWGTKAQSTFQGNKHDIYFRKRGAEAEVGEKKFEGLVWSWHLPQFKQSPQNKFTKVESLKET